MRARQAAGLPARAWFWTCRSASLRVRPTINSTTLRLRPRTMQESGMTFYRPASCRSSARPARGDGKGAGTSNSEIAEVSESEVPAPLPGIPDAATVGPARLRHFPATDLSVSPAGGPRDGGRIPASSARDARCPRDFPITAGSSILAITLTLPAADHRPRSTYNVLDCQALWRRPHSGRGP